VIIRRIRIRRFRKLLDQMLECGPGLNVVHGWNDAGKSTLHLAFSAVLYPVRPSEVKTYGTWGEEELGEITVEFDVGDRSYRLRKDLGSRRVMLESGDERIEDPRRVEHRIGELLGLTSLSLFRATAHVGQWDLAGVQHEQQEIGTRLARIVTGGDADAARVLNALDERVRRLEVGLQRPAKAPGPLKRDQDRLAVLAAEQQRLAREVEAIERAAAERDRLVAQSRELEQHIRDDEALLTANRRLLELEAQQKQLGARAKELESLLDRIARAAREVDAADRDEALVTRPQPVATNGHEIPRFGPDRPRLGVSQVAWGLLALIAGVIGVALLGAGKASWGTAALGVAAALVGITAIARGHQVRKAADEAMVRAGRSALIREAEERRERALLRQASARTLLSELLGGRTREELSEEQQRTLLDLGVVRAQREDPDLALRRLDPAGFQRLQAEAAARKLRFDETVKALHRLEGQLSGRSSHEDLARVEEEIAETRARLASHQRFDTVLKLTRDRLLEAHRSTIVPGKAVLEERAGRYLRQLSGGVYDRVAVDEHTLAPRVWVGPPKEWAEVASREIGSGAVDQCYLALRLALVDVLCDDRCPPLFLDDPFLAYDEHRAREAMYFLRQLARDRQIFLLTCRGEYHKYADRLIVLGAVSAPAPAP
jgi:uncharacterized protein YhaN